MLPITRKGRQHGTRTGGWKKCVVPPSCWDSQQAPQDCTGKALNSLEYRNTGWNPAIKERKLIKMRKCTANEALLFWIICLLQIPQAITSFWMISCRVHCSPHRRDRMMVLPHHPVSFSPRALSACLLQGTESSLWQSLSSIAGIRTVCTFLLNPGKIKKSNTAVKFTEISKFCIFAGKKEFSWESWQWLEVDYIRANKLLCWKIKVKMSQNPFPFSQK